MSIKSGFWTLPATKSILQSEIALNQLIASLYKSTNPADVKINATSTLPANLKSKSQIYQEIHQQNPEKSGFPLKFKQFLGYGKSVIKFYKTGFVNVWNNHKQVKKLQSQFSLHERVNQKGQLVEFKITKFPSLCHEMAQVIYMSRVEHNNTGKEEVSPELFRVSRSQFQLLKRTPKDMMKIPAFAIIFAIFVEMTPLLCYVFPQITPLTCVLPSIVPRLWNSKYNQAVKQLAEKQAESKLAESIASQTPYNMPILQVRALVQCLNLVSKYIPVSWYSETVLRDRLQNHFNYLTVDNYYLSGLNGDGNVWDLVYDELVIACLERNLVLDIKNMKEEELRDKLVKHIVDAKNYNVGYLNIGEIL